MTTSGSRTGSLREPISLREPRRGCGRVTDAGASSVLPVTDGVVRRAQGSDVQALVELREHMFAAMGVDQS